MNSTDTHVAVVSYEEKKNNNFADHCRYFQPMFNYYYSL